MTTTAFLLAARVFGGSLLLLLGYTILVAIVGSVLDEHTAPDAWTRSGITATVVGMLAGALAATCGLAFLATALGDAAIAIAIAAMFVITTFLFVSAAR